LGRLDRPFFFGEQMDLRAFYQTIRKITAEITEEAAVIISRETSDGGRAGVMTEVPRGLAARLIAEGKADLAGPEEAAEFRAAVEARWKAGPRLNQGER
jgi:hypothetical protein